MIPIAQECDFLWFEWLHKLIDFDSGYWTFNFFYLTSSHLLFHSQNEGRMCLCMRKSTIDWSAIVNLNFNVCVCKYWNGRKQWQAFLLMFKYRTGQLFSHKEETEKVMFVHVPPSLSHSASSTSSSILCCTKRNISAKDVEDTMFEYTEWIREMVNTWT